jgi:GT2 family glycosyltransferase
VTRPAVSVVMPFAGDAAAARAALAALESLAAGTEDELILADNSGAAALVAPGAAADPAAGGGQVQVGVPGTPVLRVVPVPGERSPSHARNVGARHSGRDWILFLDADTTAPPDLLDRFFAAPIDDDAGALAGAVTPAPGATTLAGRYGAARNFLGHEAHLAHPFMSRAVAANLLVRRRAFDAVGGFYEGVRAAEDTDFSWRLQLAGWRLEARPEASVEHAYRTTVRELRRQWRGYAAGRAWLARRYEGFAPEPAVVRAARRLLRRSAPRSAPAVTPGPGAAPVQPVASAAVLAPAGASRSRLEHGRLLALDALLGFDELAGLALSNRPQREPRAPARAVLVADRFPAPPGPSAPGPALAGVRIEAAARPPAAAAVPAGVTIDYREDDGLGSRALAAAALVARHPLRCARDLRARPPGAPSLAAISPAVRRLAREPGARLSALGDGDARAVAVRLAALAQRPLDEQP